MSEVLDKLEEVVTPADDMREEFKRFWALATALVDDGAAFKLTLNPVKLTRSIKQNKLMWCLLRDIANQVVWHGLKLDRWDWKDVISAAWRQQRSVPAICGTGFVVLGVRTSKLNIKEMSELIDLIQAFGNEQGVKFTAPPWLWEWAR